MDTNGVSSQAVRNEHLQRLLKQFELEAHNSLRGPAMLTAALGSTSGSTSATALGSTVGSAFGGAITVSQHSTGSIQQQSASVSQHSTGSASVTKPDMETTISTKPKPMDGRAHFSSSSSTHIGSKEHWTTPAMDNRVLAVDRSVLQHQETLLKEILAMKGVIPVQSLPALTTRDRTPSASERKETLLEGEIITCFVVGGEKRLCLPQVLNTVLKSVPMVDINQASSELNIHCGHCTPEQLLALKIAGVVSATTASCALITKTDAERLSDYLLRQKRNYRSVATTITTQGDRRNRTPAGGLSTDHRQLAPNARVRPDTDRGTILRTVATGQPPTSGVNESTNKKSDAGISVIHYCFGRCRGRYFPSLYASPSAECIECNECHHLFAPDRFVVHSHGNQQRRTCHWGFDSANWRAYLRLSKEDECQENIALLEQMKLRFDVTGLTKRRLEVESGANANQAKQSVETDCTEPPRKLLRLDVQDQPIHKPVTIVNTATIPKDTETKAPMEIPSTAVPSLSMFEQSGLPYLLCNPMFLANYCQPALQDLLSNCFATALRAAAVQAGLSTPNVVPSMVPNLAPPSILQSAQPVQRSTNTGMNPQLDCYDLQKRFSGDRELKESLPLAREGRLDEATAVAALKLLQMHAGTNDCNFGLRSEDTEKKPSPQIDGNFVRLTTGESLKSESSNLVKSNSQQQHQHHHSTLPFGKEPFKKQLLHMFSFEQQQKEMQHDPQRKEEESPIQKDLGYGKAVDYDDNRLPAGRILHRSGQGSESGKRESDFGTPDTHSAEQMSVSSSDNEGTNGEITLDDLLRVYITDANALKVVRSKIAESQRYLEQKSDAVCAENRLLYAECQQLRLKLLQLRQQQQQQQKQNETAAAVGGNILVRDQMKNLTGLLSKHYLL